MITADRNKCGCDNRNRKLKDNLNLPEATWEVDGKVFTVRGVTSAETVSNKSPNQCPIPLPFWIPFAYLIIWMYLVI